MELTLACSSLRCLILLSHLRLSATRHSAVNLKRCKLERLTYFEIIISEYGRTAFDLSPHAMSHAISMKQGIFRAVTPRSCGTFDISCSIPRRKRYHTSSESDVLDSHVSLHFDSTPRSSTRFALAADSAGIIVNREWLQSHRADFQQYRTGSATSWVHHASDILRDVHLLTVEKGRLACRTFHHLRHPTRSDQL